MVPQIKQTNIFVIANLKIPGKKSNFLLVRVDIPSDSKRLVRISFYPSKVDLVLLKAMDFEDPPTAQILSDPLRSSPSFLSPNLICPASMEAVCKISKGTFRRKLTWQTLGSSSGKTTTMACSMISSPMAPKTAPAARKRHRAGSCDCDQSRRS